MSTHIHILGICGTFMGGIALLAREMGFTVSGSDANVYPPMSTQLEQAGITLCEGYHPEHLQPSPDCVLVGNALSRGNPAVEYLLNSAIPYTSGPQWLAENVLRGRWVLAVSGTHGKTTTSSVLAWLLESAGLEPGFLIGGVPVDFGVSARLGGPSFFVIEADEYDTAFFDKRSKFVHYRPRTLVINNLEFDHADIFASLADIQKQFHHLVRCVPGEGRIIHPAGTAALDDMLGLGCWTPTDVFSIQSDVAASFEARLDKADGSAFTVFAEGVEAARTTWGHRGGFNVSNALGAMLAARHVGVPFAVSAEALTGFKGVRRRQELRGEVRGVALYDDFAHHPTAINVTLNAMRVSDASGRLIAVIEPRSNTMRLGRMREALPASCVAADRVFWYQPPGLDWSLDQVVADSPVAASVHSDIEALAAEVAAEARDGDRIVVMSNGGFGGIHEKILARLETGDITNV